MPHTPEPWHWGDGWEEAVDSDGALRLGGGADSIKYASLQLFGGDGTEIIPIRIDHFDVIFDGDRIPPADRALIAAAPKLLAACREAMRCLTGESDLEWLSYQKYKEAPYHFLYAAISEATNA